MTLLRDPAGLLDPHLVTPGAVGLEVSAGLFVVTGASMLYAGRRRR
ncbi:hypothetical protein [Streptomyces sp. NPDC051162]